MSCLRDGAGSDFKSAKLLVPAIRCNNAPPAPPDVKSEH